MVENNGLEELARLGRGLGRWHWAWGGRLQWGSAWAIGLELGLGDT
jgi:hypothetical protein